jgi:hypothetical protein
MFVKWTKSRVESNAADGWLRRDEVTTAKTPKSGDREPYKRLTSVFVAVMGVVAGVGAAAVAGTAAPRPAVTTSAVNSTNPFKKCPLFTFPSRFTG